MMGGFFKRSAPVPNYILSALFLARIALNSNFRLTFLGLGWSLLNPAIQVTIYYFVFSAIVRFDIPNYPLYLISGLLPWTFFSQTCQTSAESLVTRAHILHHCRVSKTIYPVADMLNHLFVHGISLAVMYVVIASLAGAWSWRVLLLPLAGLPLLLASASAAIGISFIAARARDVSHLVRVVFSTLFWLTPIIYPLEAVPPPLAAAVAFNPVHYLILPLKLCLYGGGTSLAQSLLMAGLVALFICGLSYLIYRGLRQRIIYFL